MSDWIRDSLISAGRAADEIVVTGNPSFDRLADPSLPDLAAEWRRKHGWEAVDLVITMTSTVGMEAILTDRPLIKICLSQFDATVPYEKTGVALGVYDLNHLEKGIESVLEDESIRSILRTERRIFPKPGGAAGRVV